MSRHLAPVALRTPSRSMRDRVPAQGPIEQVLLDRAALRPRTALERMVGVDPIGPDALARFAGVLAERAVAERLALLPAGWTVFHSLPLGRGGADVDHLIVGPAGVFIVDVKRRHDAARWIAGHAVLTAGRRRPHVQRAEAQARRIDRLVDGVVPDAPAVRAVVAVVGARHLRVRQQSRGVHVVRAEQVLRLLLAQPARLTAAEVAAVVAHLDDARRWQPTAEATPELLMAFAGLARDLRQAALRRAAWVLGLSALTIAGLALLLS